MQETSLCEEFFFGGLRETLGFAPLGPFFFFFFWSTRVSGDAKGGDLSTWAVGCIGTRLAATASGILCSVAFSWGHPRAWWSGSAGFARHSTGPCPWLVVAAT